MKKQPKKKPKVIKACRHQFLFFDDIEALQKGEGISLWMKTGIQVICALCCEIRGLMKDGEIKILNPKKK